MTKLAASGIDTTVLHKPGPSVATEFVIRLLGITDEHGTGAVLDAIASQRREWGTPHLNAQIELAREQHADYFLDTIIEGPQPV